jgi:hypothetical protein
VEVDMGVPARMKLKANFPKVHLNIPAERDMPSLTDVISTDRCRLFAGDNGGLPGRFLECVARSS